jgi:IS4 transposase
VDHTTLRQLGRILPAMLAMTGRVTMLNISRWTEKGGSYRTIQRFFSTSLPWAQMCWLFFVAHLHRTDDVYILAGDETVVTKAGKKTFGLDRFFSSIYNRVVPGLSFMAFSLVNVTTGRSHPLAIEQVVKPKQESKASVSKPKKRRKKPKQGQGKRGRPKGSKNKDKTQIEWTDEMSRLVRMARALLNRIDGLFPVRHLVLDGHFGNNNTLQTVGQCLGLHLISKLRHDSALYFQYDGPQKKYGPRRRYGDKIDYQAIPDDYLVSSTQEKDVRTEIYQATMLHKSFAQPLNVVIIVKVNLVTKARAHAVLFSSDLALDYETLIRYYRLRFQIEFNFRDAKQFWGLEDFMNIGETQVNNAANLAFFMVNLSQRLLDDFRQSRPDPGLLDLKAFFRGRRYAQFTLELLPLPPASIFIDQIVQTVAALGSIHSTTTVTSFEP